MVRRLLMGVALVGLFAASASAARPTPALAEANARGSAVDWSVLSQYQKAVLTVSMPDGAVLRSEFSAGTAPTFSAFGKEGEARPDGSYTWELRLEQSVAPDVQRRLAAARARGDEAAARKIQRANGLDRELVQTGSFMLNGGAFVGAGETEARPQGPAKKLGPVTAADQVIPDDLIVQGSTCVGLDCIVNENFSFDTIRLKENNLRIHFDDTSAQAGFPANDWRLIANDSASGGQSKFSIEDSTGARTPFTVEAGATTNSIYVDSTGRIGLRTSTPVLDLHINTSNTPAIRLEQNSSGGFTAQTWDIAGNEANFFVRDVTGGSRLPFRIRPGAPTSSVDISADGDVGIGTASPETNLHVFSSNTEDSFVGLGPDPNDSSATESAFNIGYGGASLGPGSGFLNVRPGTTAVAPNPSIRILTANVERFIIDNEGNIGFGSNVAGFNPTQPLVHQNTNARLEGGIWTDGSSRAIKHDIRDLAASDALAAFRQLSPVRYYPNASPNEEFLGFIAEDVPGLVAMNDRNGLSPMDIAALLTKVVQVQQQQIDELKAQLDELEAQSKTP